MTMNKLLVLLAFTASVVSAQVSWVDIVSDNPDASMIEEALRRREYIPADPENPFLTIFLPLNSAFAAFEQENGDLFARFFTDDSFGLHLDEILNTHVILGNVSSADINNGVVAERDTSETLTFVVSGQGNETVITVTAPNSNATVVDADNVADDGIVHFVDGILLPGFVSNTLLDVLTVDYGDELTILLDLLGRAEVQLPPDSVFTILAPTDAAFDQLGEETLNTLRDPANKVALQNIVLNHVIGEVFDLEALTGQESIMSVSRQSLAVEVVEGLTGDILSIGGVAVVDEEKDILANDGILHLINGVIVFPGQLGTADTNVPAAAPTDMPAMVPSETVVPALEPTQTPAKSVPAGNVPTVDEILLNDTDLSLLAGAFDDAGLIGALCTDCFFTTFAPVNGAFEGKDDDYLLGLVLSANKTGYTVHRQNFLEYHVSKTSDARVLASDLIASVSASDGGEFEIEMLNGENVTVTVNNGTVLINGNSVVEADIMARNGNVHKISEFLKPGFWDRDLFDLQQSFPDYTVVNRLLKAVGLSDSLPGEYTLFVPDDNAFAKFGEENIKKLENSISDNGIFLLNHVVQGVVSKSALVDGMKLETIGEELITIKHVGDDIYVNGAKIIGSDVLAKNGIAFGLDNVLNFGVTDPPTAVPVGGPAEITDPPAAAPGSSATTFSLLGASLVFAAYFF